MNKQELIEHNLNRKICQIGFVVKDIEAAVRHWVEELDIGPWRFVSLSDVSVTDATYMVDGINKPVEEPHKIICALCNLANIQIELIQPVYGPSIHARFLEEHGEGLHHIKEQIRPDEWKKTLSYYKEEKGMDVIGSGKYGRASYAYINSEQYVSFPFEFGDNIPNETFPEGSELHFYPEE